MNNIPYLLALHSINGLGPIRLKAILEYFKDPKLAWEGNLQEFQEIGIPQKIANLLGETRKKIDPETYAEAIKKNGIKWVSVFDGDYPNLLKQIYDPPTILYYQGEFPSQEVGSVGVVGTRKMTGYGKVATEQFTQGLINAGLTIVSGLARGIDSQAHLTAVEGKGKTIAVLGGGLNRIFPPENRGLANKIASGFGAVVSEFPPNYPALAGNFPARNRIISGLSLAILVVEAAQGSGSLITARLALEQGREVFAIPGPVTSALSKGPIDLIKQGAVAVFSPDEILEELGINRLQDTDYRVQNKREISEEERQVLAVLENENRHIDEIGRQLHFASPKISALLLKMEISGLVSSIGAGIYCKKNPKICPS